MTGDLSAPPRLGDSIGHYELISVLGRGGMGVVYLAEDRSLRRRVALKMLPPETASDPERLKRFRREAKTVAALSHPNVVTLHSVEEDDGRTFLTMELVEGKTLAEEIPIGGLPLRRALEIAGALAGALAAAHQRGILHRDLKPSNVMITPSGWVKVLDFGLAKLRPPDDLTLVEGRGTSLLLTQEGKILGTPSYMSPEQLRGHPIDERSDLFSFGLILHEMLTGAMPFAGQTSAERIASVLRDPPAPLVSLRPDAPVSLVRLVERCLAKALEERPASAVDVEKELAAIRRDLEIGELMVSSGLTKPPKPAFPRIRWQVAAAALALVALAGFGVWQLRAPRRASAAAPAPAIEEAARPSIAVLPLGNFSGEPDYFVDGMTDALIGSLARLGSVRVISRQSSMHYKGSAKLLSEIAAELDVDYVVEGSIARRGDRVILQAQVLRPDPEEQLWSRSFDRVDTDVLALHNEAARGIAGAVRAPLSRPEEARLESARKVDPVVYEVYLQGRYWAGKFSEDDLRKAKGYFERAVALDASFAPAWAGLSETLVKMGLFHTETGSTLAEAEAAARRALQIDETVAEGWSILSDIARTRWEWSEAENLAQHAIELDPSSAQAHRRYWLILAPQLRLEEARREIEAAGRLDPLSAHVASNVGIQYVFEKSYDEAERQLRRAVELDPDYGLTHGWLWMLYAAKEQDPERGIELARYVAAMGFEDALEGYDERLAAAGYESALRWLAHRVAEAARNRPSEVGVVGGLLAEAGEIDAALDWLRLGAEERVWEMAWIAVTPDYDNLHGDARYQDLLEQLALPDPRRGPVRR